MTTSNSLGSASPIDATLRDAVIALAREAGAAIMQVYRQDFDVEHKDDKSPLTQADLASHRIICEGLAKLTPDIPLLSEESVERPWEIRAKWRRYWLVDPLDGTREFVKKNGEFTVNIALVENHAPVFGVVQTPALDELHWAAKGVGAFRREGNEDVSLSTRRPATTPLRVAASRSHLDERTAACLKRMGEIDSIGLGSSLKFCRIAEARLDFYPRFGPTSEWDTAAAQVLVECAGGAVLNLDGTPLRYNTKESLLNPYFLVLGDPELPWRSWLDA
jgi:3'(2'), 5'-bisphosphate nucleotidase